MCRTRGPNPDESASFTSVFNSLTHIKTTRQFSYSYRRKTANVCAVLFCLCVYTFLLAGGSEGFAPKAEYFCVDLTISFTGCISHMNVLNICGKSRSACDILTDSSVGAMHRHLRDPAVVFCVNEYRKPAGLSWHCYVDMSLSLIHI